MDFIDGTKILATEFRALFTRYLADRIEPLVPRIEVLDAGFSIYNSEDTEYHRFLTNVHPVDGDQIEFVVHREYGGPSFTITAYDTQPIVQLLTAMFGESDA